jgi:NhaA family Na+:H+ antiporter
MAQPSTGHGSDDLLMPLLPTARVDRLTAPLRRFFAIQSSSGLMLVGCTVLALFLANSPWANAFDSIWQTSWGLSIGSQSFAKDLLHVINDGLMTIFFFVVGLEIKREVVAGELRDPRQAALPIVAAAGGMLAPALVFLAVSSLGGVDAVARKGWAIPMATDIAFVVGVLTLFGDRIPSSLKVLLLTLAIVDDLGAVLVIALVFTETIHWSALAAACAGLLVAWMMRASGVRQVSLYVIMGAAIWLSVLKAGVHPTVAGVLLGLMTPARPWVDHARLAEIMETTVTHLRTGDREAAHARLLSRAEFAVREGISPLERLERLLHPWVAFGIMPLFALANAGVPIRLQAATDPVAISIAAGLAIGKPVGILGFSAIAIALGLAKRPVQLTWGLLAGGACLSGIGFTMSIFLAGLALPDSLLDAGKLGTLIGSMVSAVFGSFLLLRFSRRVDP